MDKETAVYLNTLNTRFYASVHESFSATRSSSWPGWSHSELHIRSLSTGSTSPLQVLDLACGNMRFEKFLNLVPSFAYEAHCVDNCRVLADPGFSCHYTDCDIVASLLERDGALEERILTVETYDLVACFGFFHHLPGNENRQQLLSLILKALKPGGIALVSLWRFMDNQRLRSKALQSHAAFTKILAKEGFRQDQLEEGDFFLAWQSREDVCRYCHHFSEAEIEQLVDGIKGFANVLERYREDGKDHRSNEYLVLQRI